MEPDRQRPRLVRNPLKAALGAAREGLASLLFPNECLFSGEPVEPAKGFRYLGSQALASLALIESPLCRRCGAALSRENLDVTGCAACAGFEPLFEECRSCFSFTGAGRGLIIQLKYHGGCYLADDLAGVALSNRTFAAFLEAAVLVPVPLHPRKQREREYNQAEVLAKAIASRLPNTEVGQLLCRVRDTQTQTSYDREHRRQNVARAFALRHDRDGKPVQLDLAKRYIVVDDVYTTGSTLSACAAVLKAGGAAQVDGATLARG